MFMGSFIELNDTLQITTRQGFPADVLDLNRHRKKPIRLEEVAERVFEFHNKEGARVYHPAPTRCFLVHNINRKWLYWGKIIIIEQIIKGESRGRQTTSGRYKIIAIYKPEYQEQITKNESPEGLSYF